MTLGPPPPGVELNFVNPETESARGHVSMTLCIVIGTVFLLLRLFVKVSITKLWGWDDCKCIEITMEFRTIERQLTSLFSLV